MKSSSLLVSALVLGALPLAASAQFDVWTVNGGRVSIHFQQSVLDTDGLAVIELDETATSTDAIVELTELPLVNFTIDNGDSNLLFLQGENEGFVPYGILGGSLHALGGFRLVSGKTGRAVDFHDFVIHPFQVRNDGPDGSPDPDYFALSAHPAGGALDNDLLLRNVKIQFAIDGVQYEGQPGGHGVPTLVIKSWDMVVTDALAAKLGQPELAGRILATGKVEGDSVPWTQRWQYPAGQNPFTPYTGSGSRTAPAAADSATLGTPTIDVKLGLMQGITALGHVGTFGSGRAGLSMSTTSCNLGASQVTWLAAMNENHPGIAMQLYRQNGLRFEQVGVSWIKHGFFALANSQCTPCQGGSAQGKFLGIGCSDTYGTSNNGDRMWLGPRNEWDVFTAHWTCLGSYFDGLPADCVRSESGAGLGAVEHRLEAFDADLNNADSQYFYEAMYMVRQDEDLSNNIGSRRCTMVPNGSSTSWIFATPTTDNALLAGPAINRYGEMRTQAGLGPADGDVVLAVQTADLGGGLWRYEYALFNWNLDRQVRAFSVPTGAGSATDFYFHDVDDQTANDWVPAEAGGNLTWTFPDVVLAGTKVGGPLEFCTLYNFGFTSDVAPGTRNAGLTIHVPGPGGDALAVSTIAPAGLNFSASKLSPVVGEVFDLQFHGGSASAIAALFDVGGVTLPSPVLIGPIAFDGNGDASIPLVVPAELTGLTLGFAGGEVTTSPLHLVHLSNQLVLHVQ